MLSLAVRKRCVPVLNQRRMFPAFEGWRRVSFGHLHGRPCQPPISQFQRDYAEVTSCSAETRPYGLRFDLIQSGELLGAKLKLLSIGTCFHSLVLLGGKPRCINMKHRRRIELSKGHGISPFDYPLEIHDLQANACQNAYFKKSRNAVFVDSADLIPFLLPVGKLPGNYLRDS